jgi:tetratricopeptide (TPR) repeat protein
MKIVLLITFIALTIVQFFGKLQSGDLDETLKAAKNVVETAIMAVGTNHSETAKAYKNLGEIYRMKHKFGDAADAFQKAYEIYQTDFVQNEEAISRVLNSFAMALVKDGKGEKGTPVFLQAVEKAEKLYKFLHYFKAV